MNYALLVLFVVLMHISLCSSQDKALDVAGNVFDSIVSAPGKTIRLVKKDTKDAVSWMLGDDPVFSQCFSIPNAFCLGGTTKVVTATAVPQDLVGWWKFDEIYPIDHTGYANHMHKPVRAGPAAFGHGASAAFYRSEGAYVSSSESLKTDKFTVAFWMYLLEDSTGFFRKIFTKGTTHLAETPVILLYPNSRRLSVRVSIGNGRSDGLASIGTIPLRRWTHIAVTGSENKVKIYINGIKDNEITTKNLIVGNSSGIKVGATLVTQGFEGYMDDLRYYRKALTGAEIASLTSPGLTGIVDRDLVSLGCAECDYSTAVLGNVCPDAYKLCTLEELFEGGLHIARANGWLAGASDIWHAKTSMKDVEEKEKRIAICCKADSSSQDDTTNQIEL